MTLQERLDKGCRRLSNGCLVWLHARTPEGYGVIQVGHQARRVHRIAWELKHGPIQKGMLVLHHCDNPPCREETHLFVGTTADNVADKVRKGRQARGRMLSQAKLTEADVRMIRSSTKTTELARRLGVSRSLIKQVRRGDWWRHVQ